MAYYKNPIVYPTGRISQDTAKINENFAELAKSFVNEDPTTYKVINADKVDDYHASQIPMPNTIPVAGANGKLNAEWLPAVGFQNRVVFTSSGTWVVPSGVTSLIILAVGGGGGGGGYAEEGGNVYGGEGGGAGDYIIRLVSVVPNETLTITIGAGGAGGGAGSGGGNGGSTSVVGSVSGTLVLCLGGLGGYYGISRSLVGLKGESCLGRGANRTESAPPNSGAGGGGGSRFVTSYPGGNGGSGYVEIYY